MAKDKRDILQVLKVELDFLEQGGYSDLGSVQRRQGKRLMGS
jgi:hypothetical protein